MPTISRNRFYLSVALIIGSLLFVYSQVAGFDFINFDDNLYVYENHNIEKGITKDSLSWAFKSVDTANWHPVTWLSHIIDVELYGLNPGGHHLTNFIIHLLNTFLLLYLLTELTGRYTESFFVAWLFAIHPLHVESVAWISERKDVLSIFFGLSAFIGYGWYVRKHSTVMFAFVFFAYALSLMSKPMLVTFPIILCLLDFWPLKRIQPASIGDQNSNRRLVVPLRILVEKMPFFFLAFAASAIALFTQSAEGAMASIANVPLAPRMFNAAVSYVKYIQDMFWPVKLCIFYPFDHHLELWKALICALMITLVTLLVLFYRKTRPYLMVGWFWYLTTLLPVIGIVQIGMQARADRYTYFPLIGIFILFIWAAFDVSKQIKIRENWVVLALSLICFCLMLVSWRQVTYWDSSLSIFRHAIKSTRDNDLAHCNYGRALAATGRLDEGIMHIRKAITINPHDSINHNSLGLAFIVKGDIDKAIVHFKNAVKYNRGNSDYHNNIGVALEKIDRLEEAQKYLTNALRIKPDNHKARSNLARVVQKMKNS